MQITSVPLCIAAIACAVSIQSANAQTTTINVTASPLWTDTDIQLELGTTITITASGTWSWSALHSCGPTGTPANLLGVQTTLLDQFYSGANHGALIAYIGVDPTQGQWGNGSFFPQATGYWDVGNEIQLTAPYSGELWLGLNDDAVSEGISDNSGSLTAELTLVPEPDSLALAVIGAIIGCAGALKRRLR